MIRTAGYLAILIAGIAAGVIFLSFLLAGEIYEYEDSVDGAHLPEVDAIVCLAGGRGRISAAGDLWYRYWESYRRNPQFHLPVLYYAGMGPSSTWSILTRQLRPGVLDVIRPDQVVLETESSNTNSNARYLARYAATAGWKKILLVTSRYHMRRSKWIFEKTLKNERNPVEVETLSVYQEPFEPGEWRNSVHGVHVTLTEYFKWFYYKLIWSPG